MKRFIKEKNVDIRLSDSAKEHLVEIGYDPVYGARPLKRALQKEILNPLVMKLLDGTFKEGDAVEVDFEDGRVVFRKKALVEAVRS